MAKNKNSEPEADLEKYRSLSGVSLREMNFGLWLAQQRRNMLKIVTGALILFCAFLFLYSSYNYFIYFMSGDIVGSGDVPLSPRQVTSPLDVSPLEILENDGHYDLVAKVKNPNEKFSGSLTYCFTAGDQDILCRGGFILPGEEKYFIGLGQNFATGANVSFRVKDLFWRRLDAHAIPDWQAFADSRLKINIQDLEFRAAAVSGLSDKVNLNYLSFTAENQTPYGYYEAPLDILLYNGSRLVGAQRYLLSNFLPGESRSVRISWSGRLETVTRTEVRPDINILDDQVYLKYQGSRP